MYIEMKTFTVKQGFGEKMLERFSGKGPMSQAEGFVELTVMKNVKKGDTEEIICMTKWADQKAFTNWKTSDAHQAGHKNKKERPEYIVDVKMCVYNVEITRTAENKSE